MYSLASFSISDMTECASELRKLGAGALSTQDVAQRIASYLYQKFGDDQTGRQDCILVRCFLTRSYRELDPQSQDCARRALACGPGSLDMKCLTLFGTAGEKPEWNEIGRSRHYRAIPLSSEPSIPQFPMVSQLLQQLGVAVESKNQPKSDPSADRTERTLNIFHVAEAKGSPFVPAQEEFVIPFGIESVLGFGGVFPSKEFFTVILFSRERISRETAELFKPLALSVKLALLPFDEGGAKRSIIRVESQPGQWQARAEALEQLLAVHEQTSAHSPLQGAQAEARLRRLYETTSASLSFADKLAGLLTMGCEELGLELGVLAKAEGNTLIVEALHALELPMTAGMSFTIEETYCRQTLRSTEPVGVEHAGASHEWREHPFYKVFSLEAYLGAQVLVEGEVFGTLSFSSRPPHPLPFTEADKEFLKLMAQWVGGELERKRVEQELTTQQAQLEGIIASAMDAIITVDEGERVAVFNRAAESMFLCQAADAIGQPFDRFIPERFRQAHDDLARTASRSVERPNMQFGLRANGEEFPIEASGSHVQVDNKNLFTVILRDVTERKQLQEEQYRLIRDLIRSKQHFHTLFNLTPSAVGISTLPEGRFCDVNEGFSRLTGYGQEEVIGRTTVELGLWADPSERAIVLREIQEQGYVHNREGLLRTKSGEIRSLMISVDPIQLGSTPCLIYLAHDITDRKQAEEALRLAKFSMERAADAVYWIDPQAKILDVNEAASLMLGYSKDELCAMTIHDLNPDFQADMWPGFWAETKRRGTMVLETAHRAKNGRLIPVEVAVNYLSHEGKEYHCAFVRDITERKRVAEEISQLAERLELATSAGQIGVWDWNIQKNELVWDDRMFTLYRVKKEDFGGAYDAWLSGVHPADRARCDGAIQQAIRKEKPYDIEFRISWPDGTVRVIKADGQMIWGKDGTPLRMTGVNYDITDRRKMEEELRGSEARLRAILDNSPGMIFLKDTEGRYLDVNHQLERAFHVTREQIVGKTDEAIFAPKQVAAFRANDLKVLQAGRPLEFEEVAMQDDGPHTSIVSKFPLYDGNGKQYALCGITTDITDRKQMEVAMRESEERYRSIFENAVEGIFQTTLDGKYVAVNPALARMYGYDSPEDMIATITNIADQVYVDPGRRDEFIRLMQAHEEVTGFEALVYRKDGSFIWISENVRALCDQAGTLVGYEGTVENITERKLVETRLHNTLDQVRMLSGRIALVQEEERTRIARELHDELGVGLTCLKIDLSRLQTIMGERGEAKARKKVGGKIRSMSEQIDAIIVSVQRLVTELRPAILDDLGLVAAIEWQCQDFHKRTGIPCTCVTSADDITMEPARATALFRICQEALTNTARHAQATAVTVKLESWNNSLQLVVADNGVGISETKVSDRQSLGLLGMKERVALFGGELTIQGHPEKGTTVTACLPRCLSGT
jgi:PAS domain S-box-containing protein